MAKPGIRKIKNYSIEFKLGAVQLSNQPGVLVKDVAASLSRTITNRRDGMTRSYDVFPDDENGDVLWEMAQGGDDLSLPREVNFSVIFPTEETALKFAVHLLRNEQKVSFAPYEEHDELPWQVEAHPVMVLTHANVSGYEAELEEAAARLGGRNDGWGCYAQ